MATTRDYIPPTYLSNLKYHLRKNGRVNIHDRDRRLLNYIRELQMAKNNSWWFKFKKRFRDII